MSPEDRQRVEAEVQRLADDITRYLEGTVPVIKRCVEAKIREGTTFTVTLPVKTAS